MKPVWSDEELQILIETRATVNTVPPTGADIDRNKSHCEYSATYSATNWCK